MSESSELKPIRLWWRPKGPNPAKVIIILEELRIPYIGTYVELSDLKQPAYESVNPNGRVPAIHDPNTNITLFETGAIINYIITTYDKAHKLSYDTFPEKHHLDQWSYYQTSGQGPYFGQAAWFLFFHSGPVDDSVKERYLIETRRVIGVLDKWLAERAKETSGDGSDAKATGLAGPAKDADGNVWLVGNKITYVDLMFVTWNNAAGMFLPAGGGSKEDWDPENTFPHFWKWQTAMMKRPSCQKALSMEKVEDLHL